MKNWIYIGLFSLLIVACSEQKTIVKESFPPGKPLTELMVGSFDSKAQAAADSNYYDITLHMYPIWPDEDITYLYVEQSVSSNQRKPYRQRVYKVESMEDGSYKSSVYKLPHDSVFIGRWRTPRFFDDYSPADLIEREGCAVYMKPLGTDYYRGSTKEKDCKSTLRGANYATSTVEVVPGQVTSWDQGFDLDDKQVWGAVDGPYIFLKKVPATTIMQKAVK